VGEVTEWDGHPQEAIEQMLARLEALKKQGIEAINE
jgi:hypothetical protein